MRNGLNFEMTSINLSLAGLTAAHVLSVVPSDVQVHVFEKVGTRREASRRVDAADLRPISATLSTCLDPERRVGHGQLEHIDQRRERLVPDRRTHEVH